MPNSDEMTFDGRRTVAKWWELYANSPQVRHKGKVFAQFVSPGDLVFDIGANRGGMTYVFRQLGCRVIAVEPLHIIAPERVKEFKFKFLDDDDVTLIPMAVSPEPSIELFMPDTPKHWIITSGSKRWREESKHSHLYKHTKRRVVPGITLGKLIKRFGMPKFIKVDVEGFDGEVICTLDQPVAALNMEFHRDWLWNNQMAIEHLNTLGRYEYNYALNNEAEWQMPEWRTGDRLMVYLDKHLDEGGPGSWGDIYARRVN